MNINESEQYWKLRTLKDAYAEREPTQYIIDGMFSTYSLSMIYGAPGGFKSMLAADMCVHVVAGTNWLPCSGGGIEVTKSAVLWVDMDNGLRRTDERFDAIGTANNLPADALLYYISMPSPTLIAYDYTSMDILKSTILETKAALVVIDNLGLILGDVEENSAKMAAIMGNLRAIAERTGAAIVVIHHSRKGGPGGQRIGEALRGHSSIEASLDLALYVVRDSEDKSRAVITSTKTRGVDVPTMFAKFNFTHRAQTKDLETAWFSGIGTQPGNRIENAIIAIVSEHGEIAVTALVNECHESFAGIGKKKIRKTVDHMVHVRRTLSTMKTSKNSTVICLAET